MPDDPAAAALDEIRERAATLLPMYPDSHYMIDALVQDVPRLLAAVEAALKASGRWATEAARLDKLAMTEADPQSRIAISLRAQALEDCARDVRAITTTLAGETEKAREDGEHDR